MLGTVEQRDPGVLGDKLVTQDRAEGEPKRDELQLPHGLRDRGLCGRRVTTVHRHCPIGGRRPEAVATFLGRFQVPPRRELQVLLP